MLAHTAAQFGGQGTGKGHAFALHHEIHVMVGPIQQKVANEAAHHIDRHVQLLPQTARQLQQMTHPRGQTVTQQLGHIALARVVLLIV